MHEAHPRHRPGPSLLQVFFLLVLVLLWAPALVAQEDAAELEEGDDGLFIEAVDVNVVNVDVYVTDKKGNRITGLTADDFELFENGQPVEVTNFYAVEGGRIPGEDTEVPESVERLPVPEDPRRRLDESDELPEEQQLHLIVYVDNFNLHPFTRNRTLGAVRTFLRTKLKRGDRVMLVSYDRSLHIRHPFTNDPELIASALYELEEVSAHAVHHDSERKDILQAIYETDQIVEVYGRARQYAESVYNDLSFTISALRDYIDMLAGLPGRKAVLYVSDGVAMRAGEDVFYALDQQFRESTVLMDIHNFDASRDFQQLTSVANSNRVTFYTIDAAGLRTYSYMDASNSTPLGGARIDQIHFSNIQGPLVFMAEQTGGISVLNTNNALPMLERIADDFGTYYSLGYSPSRSGTGRYRRLEVKIKDSRRNGWRVRHREGYRDRPVRERVSASTMAALHFGYQSNPLGAELEFTKAEPTEERDRYLVTLMVKIPVDNVSFLPQAGMQRARLRLFVAAKDSEGGLAPVQELPLSIEVPDAQFGEVEGKLYHYQMQLMMRTGQQMIAVGVRDDFSATTSVIARGLAVGS